MFRVPRSLQCVVLGAGLALSMQHLMITGSAGAALATRNGDVNGDGAVDLSDAVYLLNFLFKGGEPVVAIDCGDSEPEPGAPQFRFLNDLTCNGGATTARFEICGGDTLTRQTNEAFDACLPAEASSSCLVKVSVTAACGAAEYCAEIDTQPGTAYDFVFTVNGGAPALLLLSQPLRGDGTCPPFPTPGSAPDRVITDACAGLGAGGALAAASWAAAGGW